MKIAFYRGNSFIDKKILLISRGGYTHVCIVKNDESIIEAYPFKGVRERKNITNQMNKGDVIDVFNVPTTQNQDSIIENFLTKQIGKGYDYWAIAGFIFYTSNEGRKGYGRWICSELVFAAFQKAGINLLERTDAWKVSPTILSFNTIMQPVENIIVK